MKVKKNLKKALVGLISEEIHQKRMQLRSQKKNLLLKSLKVKKNSLQRLHKKPFPKLKMMERIKMQNKCYIYNLTLSKKNTIRMLIIWYNKMKMVNY
jgi:hypothetical protein